MFEMFGLRAEEFFSSKAFEKFGGELDLLATQIVQKVPVELRVGGAVGGTKNVPPFPGEYATGCPGPATK